MDINVWLFENLDQIPPDYVICSFVVLFHWDVADISEKLDRE